MARFDDLAAFAAVVREGSFTRAAAQLGVSQPALSQTVRVLERRLDLKLLNRTTRSVSPTEAGERLYQTVGPRLADIEAELAGTQTTMASVKDRHAQTSATLGDMLQQISGVSNEEVGAQILTLQTRMQASMQTTAMMYQLSLTKFI